MDLQFHIGDRVRFLGIGKGKVVSVEIYQGRPFFLVKFEGASVPHLCAGHEIVRY